jgi:hypothetical protein
MFFKRPSYKRFEYIPRFYNPNKDLEERRKRKLGFRKNRRYQQKGSIKIIIWAILIFIILWFINKFSN